MKKLFFALAIIFGMSAFYSPEAQASHFSGGDISFKHIAGDTYVIYLNIFRRCNGAGAPPSGTIRVTNDCGASFNITLTKSPNVVPIAQLCATVNDDCNGGTFPGNEIHHYSDTIVLFPPCPGKWTFGWTSCCRPGNPTIQNITGANMSALATLIDSTKPTAPFLDTAQVHFPLQYICPGFDGEFSIAPKVETADSLVYSMDSTINGLSQANLPTWATFQGSFSPTNPLPNWKLDSVTGNVTYSTYAVDSLGNPILVGGQLQPLLAGAYIATFRIDLYDRCTGVYKGHIQRDIQFIVLNGISCSPPKDSLGLHNFSGNATLLDSNSISMCEDEFFTADLVFYDTDSGDILDFRQNLQVTMPGVVTSVTSYTNPGDTITVDTLTINWTAPAGHPRFSGHRVTVADQTCPVPFSKVFYFDIQVLERVRTDPDAIICANQSVQLNATGAGTYKWWKLDTATNTKVPVVVGTDLSCDSCADPLAYPPVTTTFIVVGDTSQTVGSQCDLQLLQCESEDTVTITRAPDYVLTGFGDTTLCQPGVDTALIGVTIVDSVVSTYTYNWNNAATLSSNTVASPVASPVANSTYVVTVSSNHGCVKQDTVAVSFVPPFPFSGNSLGGDTLLCVGDTQQLGIEFGPAGPLVCGPSNQGCTGLTTVGGIGNGTVSNPTTGVLNGIAAPFAGSVLSSRQQYLYKQSELVNMGMAAAGGTMTEIGFFVNNLGTANPVFSNYTIKMKCVSDTSLSAWEQTGFTTVFTAKTVNVSTGWNMMSFDTPYDWDGSSSIVVDICFSNTTTSSNVQVLYETVPGAQGTGGVRYSLRNGFNGFACNATTNLFGFTNANDRTRPNTQFRYCSGLDPQALTISWNPLNGILPVDSNEVNPRIIAQNAGFITFNVTIKDTFGACETTFVDSVRADTMFDATITTQSPYCVTRSLAQFTAVHGNGVWSGTGITFPNLGQFSPAIAGVGTHQVIYAIGGNCANSDTVDVVVEGPIDATFLPQTYCELEPLDTIFGNSPGGFWTGSLVVDTANGIINPQLAPSPGTYSVTHYYDSTCFSSSTADITIIGKRNATITPLPQICVNASDTTLQAVGAGGVWGGSPAILNPAGGLFSPSTAGASTQTIHYTISGFGLCSDSDTITIQVNGLPDAGVSGIKDFCSSDTGIYSFNPAYPGGTFSPSQLFTNGITGTFGPNLIFVSGTSSGGAGLKNFTYTISDSVTNCVNSANYSFSILASPQAPITTGAKVCPEDVATLSAAPFNNDKIFWYTSQNGTGTPVDSGITLTVDLENETTFYAVAVNSVGCRSIAQPALYELYDSPSAAFTVTPNSGPGPLAVLFTPSALLDSIQPFYAWDFGGQGTADSGAAQFTFQNYGNWDVKLIVTSVDSCKDSSTVTVTVNSVVEFIVPNIFTPNGDNFNDEFEVTIRGESAITDYRLVIQDRWGRKVFDTTDPKAKWDGFNRSTAKKDAGNGVQLPSGVYFYTIESAGFDGEEQLLQGSVTLAGKK